MRSRRHPLTRIFLGLAADQRLRLLAYVNELPDQTADTRQLMAHLQISRRTVWQHTTVLVRASLLVQVPGVKADPSVGGKTPSRWRITTLAQDLIARALQEFPEGQGVR